MGEYDFIGSNAIAGNAADFSRSLMALADYVEGSFLKVIRKAIFDLYRRIVELTPVDTGRAKASWGLSTGGSDPTITRDDPEGYSVNEIAGFINEQISEFNLTIIDDQVIIYNNLEYIEALENGSSKQAPAGMVAISLAEFEAFFNNALQGFEGLVSA